MLSIEIVAIFLPSFEMFLLVIIINGTHVVANKIFHHLHVFTNIVVKEMGISNNNQLLGLSRFIIIVNF